MRSSQVRSKVENEELVKDQAKFVRLVTTQYLGYLVGQVKEIIEATTPSESQSKALKNIITDKIYDWWNNIGDKLSEEEASEATRNHWSGMIPEGTIKIEGLSGTKYIGNAKVIN